MTSFEVLLPEVWEIATSSDRQDDVFAVPDEFDVVSVLEVLEILEESEEPAGRADFAGVEFSAEDVEVPVGVGVVVTDGGS